MPKLVRTDNPKRESAFERVAPMDPLRDARAIRQLKLAAKAEERQRLMKVERMVLVDHIVVLQSAVEELTQLTRALEERCNHVSALEHRLNVLEAELRREDQAA
jgi:class 3 adenylate cyclase